MCDLTYKDVAILLCLDVNKTDIAKMTKRLYEYEFLLSIELLTRKRHWLNCSDIIVFVRRDDVARLSSTMKKAKLINKNILFYVYDEDFQFLFANKMYTNFLFETIHVFDKYKYGLALDLDMYLCSEIKREYFENRNVFLVYPHSIYSDDSLIAARAKKT